MEKINKKDDRTDRKKNQIFQVNYGESISEPVK